MVSLSKYKHCKLNQDLKVKVKFQRGSRHIQKGFRIFVRVSKRFSLSGFQEVSGGFVEPQGSFR